MNIKFLVKGTREEIDYILDTNIIPRVGEFIIIIPNSKDPKLKLKYKVEEVYYFSEDNIFWQVEITLSSI